MEPHLLERLCFILLFGMYFTEKQSESYKQIYFAIYDYSAIIIARQSSCNCSVSI